MRLDKHLSIIASISRENAKETIKQGKVLVNHKIEKNCDYKVKDKDKIDYELLEQKPITHIKPNNTIPLTIVYEDEDILVINKQDNLTVHPGFGNQDETMVNALLHYTNLSSGKGATRPGIVHRLDKDTSGLIVIAKNDNAHFNLAQQIENRLMKRSYKLVCWGVPNPIEGTITKNIARSKLNRKIMAAVLSGGKSATTHYKVLKIMKYTSLVECRLETGRTHQIRVHMSSIKHSCFGDQTYGHHSRKAEKYFPNNEYIKNFRRQALHAYKLEFIHPVTRVALSFEVDLACDIKNLIEYIDNM